MRNKLPGILLILTLCMALTVPTLVEPMEEQTAPEVISEVTPNAVPQADLLVLDAFEDLPDGYELLAVAHRENGALASVFLRPVAETDIEDKIPDPDPEDEFPDLAPRGEMSEEEYEEYVERYIESCGVALVGIVYDENGQVVATMVRSEDAESISDHVHSYRMTGRVPRFMVEDGANVLVIADEFSCEVEGCGAKGFFYEPEDYMVMGGNCGHDHWSDATVQEPFRYEDHGETRTAYWLEAYVCLEPGCMVARYDLKSGVEDNV